MIRRLIPSDIPAVLELWLRSTKQAHPFIAPGYWDENTGLVKDMLTRQAETYVFVDKHRIKGFVSLLPENFIGALFVDEKFRSRRIGTKLLNYILRRCSAIWYRYGGPAVPSGASAAVRENPDFAIGWLIDRFCLICLVMMIK